MSSKDKGKGKSNDKDKSKGKGGKDKNASARAHANANATALALALPASAFDATFGGAKARDPDADAEAASGSASSPTAGFDPAHMRKTLVTAFSNVLGKFAASAACVWPQDRTISGWNAALSAAAAAATTDRARRELQTSWIDTFHDTFKRHYAHIASKNPAVFSDARISWLAAINPTAMGKS